MCEQQSSWSYLVSGRCIGRAESVTSVMVNRRKPKLSSDAQPMVQGPADDVVVATKLAADEVAVT